jgi:integrase
MFADYARKWLKGKRPDITAGSYRIYEIQVEVHLIPAFGSMQFRHILQSDIKEKFADMEGLSINTRHALLTRLKSIFKQGVSDGIRSDNPAATIRNRADLEPKRRALTAEERAAALVFIDENRGSNESILTAIDLYTSCRRGEAFGMQWKHIDFKRRKIKICQQMRYKQGVGAEITPELKTKNSYRRIPIPQALHDILWPLRGHPEAFILQNKGGYYHPTGVESLVASIKKKCPALKELTQHFYRHNYATELHKNGVPVKVAARWMGESEVVMLRIYVHVENDEGPVEDIEDYKIFQSVAKSLPSETGE